MVIFNQAQKNNALDRSLSPLPYPNLTGAKLQGDIVLGDFIFNTIDEYGVVWVITDIKGWWQHPSADMPEISRGYGDGSYDVQGRYNARELTLEGSILVPDPSMLEDARDRFIAATNLVYKGAWLKTGLGPRRASFVRLSGDVEIETTSARGKADFSVGLRAPDPIKYDWNDTEPDGYTIAEIPAVNVTTGAAGSDTIINIGNYDVPVYIEVIGPVSSPATIYNRTRDEATIIVSGIRGKLESIIDSVQLTLVEGSLQDEATITTRGSHNFNIGDEILIEGVDVGTPALPQYEIFNGIFIVSDVPTTTTFKYNIENVSDKFNLVKKVLRNNTATLESSSKLTKIVNNVETPIFNIGNSIFVSNVDPVFNGTYVVTARTDYTVSYAKVRGTSRNVSGQILVSNKATITTTDPHEFIVGDRVTISGLGVNYNGTFSIISTPTDTTFTYATTRTSAKNITNRVLTDNVATITTSGADNGVVIGEAVIVSGVSAAFDGTYPISARTNTTISYNKSRSTTRTISIKSRVSNVSTLSTSSAHGIQIGEVVVVLSVDGFNGTFTVTAVPSSNSFSFNNTGSDVSATSVTTNGIVVVSKRLVKKRTKSSGIATITTTSSHGLLIGEVINVESVVAGYDGNNFIVLSTPTSDTFTYNAGTGNETELDSAGLITITGNITTDIAGGSATVSGSLPFTSVVGTSTVPSYVGTDVSAAQNGSSIDPITGVGFLVKKNEIGFTPNVSSSDSDLATAKYGPDILEIDTLNRDVFINGFVEGARAKIDILADFIQLSPGENIIEFEDNGNPDSDALLKVYYRSGWLG